MRLRAAIVADDLTGACDASVPFSVCGLSTRVGLESPPVDSSAAVVAVSTETRDATADDAATQVRRAVQEVLAGDPELLFKKVDSLLRGPVGAELAAARETASAPYVLLAPALPRFGRRVSRGVVEGDDGRSVAVAERLAASSTLRSVAVPSSASADVLVSRIERAAAEGADVLVCDARSTAHLRAVARATGKLSLTPLVAGAADLAWELARELGSEVRAAPPPCPSAERVLFVLGSLEQSLQRQLATLREERALPCVSVDRVESCLMTLPGGTSLVVESILASDAVPDRGATAARLARAARRLCERERFDAVVCSGGSVAAHVCLELGITSLAPLCELAPGFVVAATNARSSPSLMVLRSGSFGSDADLLDAYDRLTSGAAA